MHVWQLLLWQYKEAAASGWPLPEALVAVHQPWIDSLWSKAASALPAAIDLHGEAWLRDLATHAEVVALNAAVALLALFAMLREGDGLAELARRQIQRLVGESVVPAAVAAARAIRTMFWVIVLVSIAEAMVLLAVFALAGLPHAVGFGALAGLASAIPLVTLVVVLGAAGWLVLQHSIAWALTVAIIGTILSFVSDHFIRPIFIGRMAGLPVILALLSMIAGALSFGVVGLFLGPGLAAGLLALLRAE